MRYAIRIIFASIAKDLTVLAKPYTVFYVYGLGLHAHLFGSHSEMSPEGAAERRCIIKPAARSDIPDRQLRLVLQHACRLFEPYSLQETGGGFARHYSEDPVKVEV